MHGRGACANFTLQSAHGFTLECRCSFTPLPRQIRPSGMFHVGYRDPPRNLTAAQRSTLGRAWAKIDGGMTLTPAQLEQLCAEHDAPEEMFAALDVLGGELAKASAALP